MERILLRLGKILKQDIGFGRGTVSTYRKGSQVIYDEVNASHIPLYNIFMQGVENVEDLLKIGVHVVNNINDLLKVDRTKYKSVFALGYHTVGDGGGGLFNFNENLSVSNHDGGIYIDPNKIFPTNWEDLNSQLTWFTPSGSSNGVWVRVCGDISVKHFGAKGNGTTNDILAIRTALSKSNRTCYFPSGEYFVSGNYVIDVADNVSVIGKDNAVIFVSSQFSAGKLFNVSQKNNFTIQNISFRIPTLPTLQDVALKGIISISDCRNAIIDRVYFRPSLCQASSTFKYVVINACDDCIIRNSILFNVDVYGKFFGSETYNTDIKINRNEIYGKLYLARTNGDIKYAYIEGNILYDTSLNNIQSLQIASINDDVIIKGNIFRGNRIDLNSVRNLKFMDNHCVGLQSFVLDFGSVDYSSVDIIGNDFTSDTSFSPTNYIYINKSSFTSTLPNINFLSNSVSYSNSSGNLLSVVNCRVIISENIFSGRCAIALNRVSTFNDNVVNIRNAISNCISIYDNLNDTGSADFIGNVFNVFSNVTTIFDISPSTFSLSNLSIISNVVRLFSATVTSFVSVGSSVSAGVVMRNIIRNISTVVTGSGASSVFVSLNHNSSAYEPSGYNSSGYTLGTYTETRTGINNSMTLATTANVLCTLLNELKSMGIVK